MLVESLNEYPYTVIHIIVWPLVTELPSLLWCGKRVKLCCDLWPIPEKSIHAQEIICKLYVILCAMLSDSGINFLFSALHPGSRMMLQCIPCQLKPNPSGCKYWVMTPEMRDRPRVVFCVLRALRLNSINIWPVSSTRYNRCMRLAVCSPFQCSIATRLDQSGINLMSKDFHAVLAGLLVCSILSCLGDCMAVYLVHSCTCWGIAAKLHAIHVCVWSVQFSMLLSIMWHFYGWTGLVLGWAASCGIAWMCGLME